MYQINSYWNFSDEFYQNVANPANCLVQKSSFLSQALKHEAIVFCWKCFLRFKVGDPNNEVTITLPKLIWHCCPNRSIAISFKSNLKYVNKCFSPDFQMPEIP